MKQDLISRWGEKISTKNKYRNNKLGNRLDLVNNRALQDEPGPLAPNPSHGPRSTIVLFIR